MAAQRRLHLDWPIASFLSLMRPSLVPGTKRTISFPERWPFKSPPARMRKENAAAMTVGEILWIWPVVRGNSFSGVRQAGRLDRRCLP